MNSETTVLPAAPVPRVLILTCRFGMGHYSAATSLAGYVLAANPQAGVMICDVYEKAFPRACPAIYGAYSLLAGKGWAIYNLAYKQATAPRWQGGGKGLSGRLSRILMEALAGVIQEFQPDILISTYSLCSLLASRYKDRTGDPLPLITCITDITSHNVWINEYTDYYFVADKTTRQDLLARGVAPQRIMISGIPVRAEFRNLAAQACSSLNNCRESWGGGGEKGSGQGPDGAAGLETRATRELLIMGGGLGLLPCSRDFYLRLNREPGLHTTLITGRNRRLYRKLAGRYENITVLGYTDDVCHYMSRAHLLLSKPGGVTLFEAVYARLPIASFTPLLEQEVANGVFIRDNGLGILLDKNPVKAAQSLVALLKDRPALEKMQKNMARLGAGMETDGLSRLLAGLKTPAHRSQGPGREACRETSRQENCQTNRAENRAENRETGREALAC
jgi:UDP-N-acetylglucosamine:LPS N-acetylglucosamine transferase